MRAVLVHVAGCWLITAAAAFIAHTIGLSIGESIEIGVAAVALALGAQMVGRR